MPSVSRLSESSGNATESLLDLPSAEEVPEDVSAAALEGQLRDVVFNTTLNGFETNEAVEVTVERLQHVLRRSLEYTEAGKTSNDFPIQVLEDLFDTQSIRGCEMLFSFLEENRQIIIKHMGKGSILLRLCNELLRRLSKTEDTVLCGRILIFLSAVFPLSERSAVNLRGDFNTENKTIFEQDADDTGERSLYAIFWSLQAHFCNPAGLQTPAARDSFFEAVNVTLDKFDNLLEPSREESLPSKTNAAYDFFTPKFLTSRELLDLELSDVSFRKHICTQILITIGYLLSFSTTIPTTNKSFQSTFVLLAEDAEKVVALKDRVRSCVESLPSGASFLVFIDSVIKSDTHWLRWKSISCPPYAKTPLDQERIESATGKLATLTALPKPYRFAVGNANLTKLWQDAGSWNSEDLRRYASRSLPKIEDYSDSIAKLEAKIALVQGMDENAELSRTQIREQIATLSWLALRSAKEDDIRLFTHRVAGGHLSAYVQEKEDQSIELEQEAPAELGSAHSGTKRQLADPDSPSSPEKRHKTEPTERMNVEQIFSVPGLG